MKYTVLWQRKAEQSLADIWVRSHQREAVTQAAQEIDSELRDWPLNIGESRGGNERVSFCGCLGVAYSVSPNDAIVRVLRVWEIKQHPG